MKKLLSIFLYFLGMKDIYKTTEQRIGIMEAFLKKYGLNESEIIEFKEHALSVDSSPLNEKGLKEKLSKLSVSQDASKGNCISSLIRLLDESFFSFWNLTQTRKYKWYISVNSSVDENNDKEVYKSLKIVAKTVSTHVRGDDESGPNVPR